MLKTIDEAIEHAKQIITENENLADYFHTDIRFYEEEKRCLQCAQEHQQLVSWLERLKYYDEREENLNELRMNYGRITKDEYYLKIAEAVSKRSTCLKRRYGCVIVKNDEIISTGYNGSPRGMVNCCDIGECGRLEKPSNSGDYSDCPAVHAEQNAMLSAARKDMIGAEMYLYGEERIKGPDDVILWASIKKTEACPICKRMIKNAGIKRIINH